MTTVTSVWLLVCLLHISSSYLLLDDEESLDELLILPSEYYIKAERIDLITDTKLPLELWFSAEYNRSRVDIYDGMVRRYFYWGEDGATGTEGHVYMVYPKWTAKEGHTTFCTTIDMYQEKPIDAFPPEEEYKYAGHTIHEGQKVDVWKFTEDEEDMRREIVLYSHRTKEGEDVPVQIVKKNMNKERGSIDEHVVLNYGLYSSVVSEDDLDAEKEGECEWTSDDFEGHMKMLHPVFEGHLERAFDSFKKHHNREYQTKTEHELRRKIFHTNWKFIIDHNTQNRGFKLALNHLSDLSSEERARMKGGRRSSEPSGTMKFPHSEYQLKDIVTQIPEEFDMRLEGFISPIKNQDRCGSCWTHSTVAAVEGALARTDGRTLDLSEQSVLDCSWEGNNEGCNGGFPKEALKHIMKHGLPLEEEYGGYLAEDRCGSCWTHSTVAAVEGALARTDGRTLDLSEQSVLDCSWEGNNEGCNGGFPKEALKHIMKHGLPLEEEYGGYLAENGYCHIENVTKVFKIRGFTMVTPQSVNAMKVALFKHGPVAVTIQANDAFDFYSNGVFFDTTWNGPTSFGFIWNPSSGAHRPPRYTTHGQLPTTAAKTPGAVNTGACVVAGTDTRGLVEDYITHAVTAVGYGTRDGDGYWIIKNSYGQQWGEGGYMVMSQHDNNCFVLNEPYYPVV